MGEGRRKKEGVGVKAGGNRGSIVFTSFSVSVFRNKNGKKEYEMNG